MRDYSEKIIQDKPNIKDKEKEKLIKLYEKLLRNDCSKIKKFDDYKECLYRNFSDKRRGFFGRNFGRFTRRPDKWFAQNTTSRQQGLEALDTLLQVGTQTTGLLASGGLINLTGRQMEEFKKILPFAAAIGGSLSFILNIAKSNEELLRLAKLKLNEILTNHITVGYFILSFIDDTYHVAGEEKKINDILYSKLYRYIHRSKEVIPTLLRYIHHNLLEYVETRSHYFMRMLSILLELVNYTCKKKILQLMYVKKVPVNKIKCLD